MEPLTCQMWTISLVQSTLTIAQICYDKASWYVFLLQMRRFCDPNSTYTLSLQCASDVTPITFARTSLEREMKVVAEVVHTCRSFSRIQQWAWNRRVQQEIDKKKIVTDDPLGWGMFTFSPQLDRLHWETFVIQKWRTSREKSKSKFGTRTTIYIAIVNLRAV